MYLGFGPNNVCDEESSQHNSIDSQYKILLQRHQTLSEAFELTQTRYKRTTDRYNKFKQSLADCITYAIYEFNQIYKSIKNNNPDINNQQHILNNITTPNNLTRSSSSSGVDSNLNRNCNQRNNGSESPIIGSNNPQQRQSYPYHYSSQVNINSPSTPPLSGRPVQLFSVTQPIFSSVYTNYANSFNPIPSPIASTPTSPAQPALTTNNTIYNPTQETQQTQVLESLQRTQSQPQLQGIITPNPLLTNNTNNTSKINNINSSRTSVGQFSVPPGRVSHSSSPILLASSPRLSAVSLTNNPINSSSSSSSSITTGTTNSIISPLTMSPDILLLLAQSNFRAIAQFVSPLLLLIHQPKHHNIQHNSGEIVNETIIRDLLNQTNLSRMEKENFLNFCHKLRGEAGLEVPYNNINNTQSNINITQLLEVLLLLQSQLIDSNKKLHNYEHQNNNYKDHINNLTQQITKLEKRNNSLYNEFQRVNELYQDSLNRESQYENELKRETQRSSYYKNIILMCKIPVNNKGQVNQEFVQKMHLFAQSPYAGFNSPIITNSNNIISSSGSNWLKFLVGAFVLFGTSWRKLLYWILKQWHWLNWLGKNNSNNNAANIIVKKATKKFTGLQ